ncbi:MAG: hypothetical protein HDKAJFGB_04152 [Anaerolineae bacterium]|nr:hypothetical protein [Anaerolineae bacterium]
MTVGRQARRAGVHQIHDFAIHDERRGFEPHGFALFRQHQFAFGGETLPRGLIVIGGFAHQNLGDCPHVGFVKEPHIERGHFVRFAFADGLGTAHAGLAQKFAARSFQRERSIIIIFAEFVRRRKRAERFCERRRARSRGGGGASGGGRRNRHGRRASRRVAQTCRFG